MFLALVLLFSLVNAAQAVTLTPSERGWLDRHGPLRVGVVLQAPLAQLDTRTHRYYGADVEMMGLLAAQLHTSLTWQTYPDLAALTAAADAGQVDLAPGMVQTPASLKRWLFSDPYLRIPSKLVGREEQGTSVELDQLPLYERIAVRSPSAVAKFLAGNYPVLQREPVASERAALQQLLADKVDYAVVDEAQLNLLMREPEFARLVVVGETGYTRLLRIATRQNEPELARLVDRVLLAIPGRQLNQLYERWVLPVYPHLTDTLTFWRRLALLLCLLTLAAVGAWLWNVRQRHFVEQRLALVRQDLERREAVEAALRLTQFSVDLSTVGILWVNWDSRVRYANQAALSMLGYPADQLVGQLLSRIEPNLDMDRWMALWSKVRSEKLASFETSCLRGDGRWLPVDASLSFLRFRDSEYLVVFLTDVTEKRQAHAALEESEARLQGIAANVPGLVFRLERSAANQSAQLAFLSEASQALVGYEAASLLAEPDGLQTLVHPEDLPVYLSSRETALASDANWHWQGRILTRDGGLRWGDLKAKARRFDDGRTVWDGILWDMTVNKENELRLAESRAMLRDLSAHLESVREEEKARIAREVHDELGQVLTVLKLEVSMCELSYAKLDVGLAERLESMKKLIAQTFSIVRDVATALRPPILDAGIGSAIEWQARRFESRTQIPCLVEVPERPIQLSDAKAIGLFRVLQEALTNVMRHAEAHTVELRLTVAEQQLQLEIADDGKGFDVNPGRPRSSYGLIGIRERLSMFGGRLDIHSAPGEGCTLVVTVPLDEGEGERSW
ncbi:transporter substrate-binding domain-containing protein [Crenobacter sp. SG2303]|uniref:Transporter substrate-binding domain-containing protein n=1 Tax=Crenobacter oryzisoli TaxID=3056844 RepID=A0ABT7XN40_9NEIS|nr:transporter substrate-binding domain-containing protein [Crenobacter sp. SG2303]